MSEFDPLLGPAYALLGEAQALVGEAASQLRGYLEGLDAEPGRLDAVEARLAELSRAAERAGCDPDGLGAWAAAARTELEELATADDDDARFAEAHEAMRADAAGRAAELRRLRQHGAPRLADALREALADLAMPEARTRIELIGSDDPLVADTAMIFIQPNPGLAEAPLADVASGGELSRVLLALHGLSAGADAATWVFDEIDAGIGGVTATAVAARLAALGRLTQTLAITHLPQVAAVAQTQFVLRKDVADDGIARTEIVEVAGDERIAELCRMLGANGDDPAAREHVAQLLRGAVVA